MAKSRTKPKRNRTGYRPFCEKGLCQRNLWLAPASWRKNNPSRRRRESEFVWKNGGKSVGRASRVPPSGFEKAVKFCFGGQGGIRTPVARRRQIYSLVQLTTLPPAQMIIFILTQLLYFSNFMIK